MHDITTLLIELGAVLLGLGTIGRMGRRVGLSPIPLYLLAGLAFGHGGLLPLSASEEFIQVGAEIEDLAMALYLPVLTAVLAGAGVFRGGLTIAIAVGAVLVVLVAAIRYGHAISAFFSVRDPESLLLGVLGLTLLVAGVAGWLQVSAAVGAFLVGIALSGPVAHQATELLAPLRDLFAAVFFVFFGLSTDPADMPPVLLPALGLAVITMATKVLTGYFGAKRAGIGLPGRWRAGLALTPRGEFSVVIAGLAVTAGIEPRLAPLATGYVLITVVAGPMLARIPDTVWFKRRVRGRARAAAAAAVPEGT